jgi:hypothetical protein
MIGAALYDAAGVVLVVLVLPAALMTTARGALRLLLTAIDFRPGFPAQVDRRYPLARCDASPAGNQKTRAMVRKCLTFSKQRTRVHG